MSGTHNRYTKWSYQNRKKTTFIPDKSGCRHWMVISDETGINTHCEYCGFVEYLPKSKLIRRKANENRQANRQVLHQDEPKQNHHIKVRIRMTP